MEFLIAVQGAIRQGITADLSAYAASRDSLALLAVLPFGILFGAVHALTPGHGKTVLASYLAGSRLAVVRGLLVAGALALTHVGSAVVLALLAVPIFSRALGSAGQAPILDNLSRGLLGLGCRWGAPCSKDTRNQGKTVAPGCVPARSLAVRARRFGINYDRSGLFKTVSRRLEAVLGRIDVG
jgi:ABC-type nickel/cobalt efflux system permease component RcnA